MCKCLALGLACRHSVDGLSNHAGGLCYWRPSWACEHTFRHHAGPDFHLDMTYFSVRPFPRVLQYQPPAPKGTITIPQVPLSPEKISCPSSINLIERWAGGTRGSQICGCQLPCQLRPCHFPLACSVSAPSAAASPEHCPAQSQQSALVLPVCRVPCVAMEKTSVWQA